MVQLYSSFDKLILSSPDQLNVTVLTILPTVGLNSLKDRYSI